MGSRIECFLINPTDRYRVCLRRYSRATKCVPTDWCHNADLFVGVETHATTPTCSDNSKDFPHQVRWPKKCAACDYHFEEGDHWQVNYECVYVDAQGKEYTTIEPNQMTTDKTLMAPPGAMWRAPWLEPKYVGPDGHSYILRTPAGDWSIDGEFRHGRWTRTGVAPKLTVSPSILIGKDRENHWRYHGWLRDGFLVEC